VNDRLDLVVDGLSFPTSLTFDETCTAYVAESGLAFGSAPPGGRILAIAPSGERSIVAEGLRPPVNGLTWHDGSLWISEGGHPGGISCLTLDGKQSVVLANLPGPGNYQTNMITFGRDGKLYFSQGAMTNSGIVGLDAYALGWLQRLPHAHDLPGFDVVLTGRNIETKDPLSGTEGARTQTGAFVPFGTRTWPGQRIPAQLPCTAAVMRCNLDGSNLELVAWGVRNAYGLGFLPDGRLLAIDQGPDDRGSRPIGEAPDLLFEIRQGAWYGWPDFIDGDPVNEPQYRPERGPLPALLLANSDELPTPERALLRFPAHAAALKFDVVPEAVANWAGQLVVALFGDEKPMTAPTGTPAGRSVVRIDPSDWSIRPLLTEPLRRPIDVRFNSTDGNLYILDFGQFEVHATGRILARPRSGKLWRLQCGSGF
jgi:glucose/arabinose dehydrogenase